MYKKSTLRFHKRKQIPHDEYEPYSFYRNQKHPSPITLHTYVAENMTHIWVMGW